TEGREDILARLIRESAKLGIELGDEELGDQLLTLVAAGHETTATALTWTFQFLLSHPGASWSISVWVSTCWSPCRMYRPPTVWVPPGPSRTAAVLLRTVPLANVNVCVRTWESRSWYTFTVVTWWALSPSSWMRTWRTSAPGPAAISVRWLPNWRRSPSRET
ncbi:MAG TPA: cytochrome P450, partial [Bacteroidetes bacterium]|nr:cytochrome P450 [Bacteroidota bacterium]